MINATNSRIFHSIIRAFVADKKKHLPQKFQKNCLKIRNSKVYKMYGYILILSHFE